MPLHTTTLVSRYDLDHPEETSRGEVEQPPFERVLKFNPHHDSKTGRFTSRGGGGRRVTGRPDDFPQTGLVPPGAPSHPGPPLSRYNVPTSMGDLTRRSASIGRQTVARQVIMGQGGSASVLPQPSPIPAMSGVVNPAKATMALSQPVGGVPPASYARMESARRTLEYNPARHSEAARTKTLPGLPSTTPASIQNLSAGSPHPGKTSLKTTPGETPVKSATLDHLPKKKPAHTGSLSGKKPTRRSTFS